MELKQIENAINFSTSLENRSKENFRALLKLLSEFGSIYQKEVNKLPYHINLIDELHVNENAHSRIFAKLLSYKSSNKFPFLESFLKEVCSFDLCIEKPIIKNVDSCGRIDIPIFDNKYVVLIENKVTDKAPDQNTTNGGQIARYIETIKDKYKKKLEDIYIIYTPKYTREPSEESWENKDGFSYKNAFKNRFRSLSYRDNIYPWLKNEILPKVDRANVYLQSAIEQYLDHLEGMFSLRIINKSMNMRLQEFIKKELGLEDANPQEAIEILSEKEDELTNAITQIQLLKSAYKLQKVKKHFAEWESLLNIDFPSLEIVGDKFILEKNIINIGVNFYDENKKFATIVEYEDSEDYIYFGVGIHFASEKKFKPSKALQKILNDIEWDGVEDFWYGWKFTSFENAYIDLKNLINQVVLLPASPRQLNPS
ncbi:PD-(D/E)XK nuclease family protein [Parasediminibacterium sp. JCM 36343]|uniref:PD-(D/E)XK nuclease family protein n=1 Tax=Parasediminibacterium sp. JCM 36343 TaxID=3374279 RepID=UPI00397B48CD